MSQLKLASLTKKKNLPQLRAEDFPPISEESTGDTWAVSYADLLMVILSFFVLFFSFDKAPDVKNDILSQISISLKGTREAGDEGHGAGGKGKNFDTERTESATSQGQSGDVGDSSRGAGKFSENLGAAGGLGNEAGGLGQNLKASGAGEKSSTENTSLFIGGLAEKLSDQNLKVLEDKNFLMINLESDLYGIGQFEPNAQVKNSLSKVLNILKPFAKDISVTIVGHADMQKIIGKNKYIKDNFALSALRAAHGLVYVADQGFPIEELYATGSAANMRNSRTLSLKIQAKQGAEVSP